MPSQNTPMGNKKRSFFAILSILLILLISFNGASIFSIYIPENVAGDSRNLVSVSSSFPNLLLSLDEQNPSVIPNTQLESPQNPAAGAGDSTRFNSVSFPEKVAGDSRNLMNTVDKENPSVVSYTQLRIQQNPVAVAGDSSRFFSVRYPEKVAGDSRNMMNTAQNENPSLISDTQLRVHKNPVAGAGDSTRFFSVRYSDNVAGDSRNLLSGKTPVSNLMKTVKEQNPSVVSNTHLRSPQNPAAGAGDVTRFVNVHNSMHDVQKKDQLVISDTHLPLLRKSHSLEDFPAKNKRILEALTFLQSSGDLRRGEFRAKVKQFFSKNESSCKVRFFMTWISSMDTFSEKEVYSIETLFSTHPKGCLLIVSNSMDSNEGREILKPFLAKGFRVTAVSPDLNYLFKNTMAESWLSKVVKGDLDVGYVPLGQNLSNLLRLCLLYKFGGVYIDTDVLVLKSFSKLKNSIGAQTLDSDSKNWSRLNNAVMVFDKLHPLVYKFIEEFALTFNGNKWGHNGPYLVSRVVARLQGRVGYNFTILPPMAFYPVNWNRVRNLFRGAKNESDARWLRGKMRQIRSQSYGVHLWNKQSRQLRVEEGSIVGRILSSHCVFCDSSMKNIVRIE